MERYYIKKYVDELGVTTYIGKFDDSKPFEPESGDYLSEGVYIDKDTDYVKLSFDKDVINEDEFDDIEFIDYKTFDKFIDNFRYIIELVKGSMPV